MNKSILLLGFLLSWGLAQAAPVEDEPLPFDTKMPPRIVLQQAGQPEPERNPVVATRTSTCRTVVKKVRGRKVRQEVCSKAASTKKVTQVKASVKNKKGKAATQKTAPKSKSTKKNKRR